MKIPAVLAAGDQGAAKAIYGESKAYLEIAGRPLVAHVASILQRVPEVSEVWVVGDADRLGGALGREDLQRELCKPLRVIPQRGNLYENAWEAYRRLLPGAGSEGRDPEGDDLDQWVLYLSTDLPFATPEEISSFVRRGLALDCDYVLGLVTEESMQAFYPQDGKPGIRMAYFNLREGRFRQSNLHLVRPARLGNRHYIEEMYRHRFQRQVGPIVALAWRLLTSERGGLAIVWYYALMHLAGLANRHGFGRIADLLRRWIPIARVERGCGDLLRTRFRFVVTEIGGCGVDIDNEHDFEVARERFAEWKSAQAARVASLCGPRAIVGGGRP
jgi:molybdopterin-guanine dinucleotide biosynthesis protein A